MKVSKFLVSSLFFAALTLGFVSCNNNEENPDDPFGGGTNNGGSDTPGNTESTAKGDGTEANPYNVQFLLDLKTNGELADKGAGTEKAWVEGYIVGSYVFDNDPQFVIGAEPNDQNNVLIADDANSTDTWAVSALKLGNFKTLVNLKDVPANLKKKIKVYGVVEKYCGISGVVNLEKVFIDDTEVELPGVTDVEVNDNMTPSEAHAAAAQLQAGASSSNQASVVGYVSKITEYNSQYNNITIYMSDNQDTQETFYVFRMKGGETLKVGDKIKVTGNLTNYKGTSPQMNTGATYELLEAAGGGSGSEGEGEGEGEGSGSEGGEVAAGTVVIDYTSVTEINTTVSGVTIECASNAGNPTAYNSNSQELRLYRYNSMTISAAKNIEKIVITFSAADRMGYEISANTGTYTSDSSTLKGTWDGSASSVTITNNGDTDHNVQARIKKIEVTIAE
jgi:hypothetical protein